MVSFSALEVAESLSARWYLLGQEFGQQGCGMNTRWHGKFSPVSVYLNERQQRNAILGAGLYTPTKSTETNIP